MTGARALVCNKDGGSNLKKPIIANAFIQVVSSHVRLLPNSWAVVPVEYVSAGASFSPALLPLPTLAWRNPTPGLGLDPSTAALALL